MSNIRLIDCHTHTSNSPDGKHSTYAVCQQALLNRLGGLAITDHCECDQYRKDRYDLAISSPTLKRKTASSDSGTPGCWCSKGWKWANPSRGRKPPRKC